MHATATATIWSAAIRVIIELKRNVIRFPRVSLFRFRYHIPDAADRMHLNVGADFHQPLAEPVHINLDGVGADLLAEAIKAVFEKFLRDHAAAAAQQVLEDGEFARTENFRPFID